MTDSRLRDDLLLFALLLVWVAVGLVVGAVVPTLLPVDLLEEWIPGERIVGDRAGWYVVALGAVIGAAVGGLAAASHAFVWRWRRAHHRNEELGSRGHEELQAAIDLAVAGRTGRADAEPPRSS